MDALVPALRVAAMMKLRKARQLPIDGDILVDPGERVAANDIVARAAVWGEALRLNLVEALDLRSGDEAARYLLKSPGDSVRAGEEIARNKGSFGKSGRVCTSPIDGTLASGPTMSGDILISPHPREIELEALLPGQVVGILPRRGVIVESVGAYVQCIAANIGDTDGTIKVVVDHPSQPLQEQVIDDSCSGAILVAGSVAATALHAALIMGVRAVVVGSITAPTFRWLQDNPQPVTLVVTEGFGSIPMAPRTFELFRANAQQRACIFAPGENNRGSSHAELFIPAVRNSLSLAAVDPALVPGATVRIVRGSLFGAWARVVDLPSNTPLLGSGVRSEVVKVVLDDSREILISRSNVELVD